MAQNLGSFKVTDNSKLVKNAEEAAIQKALHSMGLKWKELVAPGVPVDTGNLRNSSHFQSNKEQKYVKVGFSANYAPHVELGTRTQKAQPFLRPSIENNIDEYKRIAEDALKNA